MDREASDEAYVVGLCERVLGRPASRQHRFAWLLGDPGKGGRRVRLPVDAFWEDLGLVVEYRERQHDQPTAFFDKPDRLTVSGVHRGEQRALYDRRREELIPAHGLRLVVMRPADLDATTRGRLRRDEARDLEALRRLLGDVGAEGRAAPPDGLDLCVAGADDAAELLVLQRCCWVAEAVLNQTLQIPALHEDLPTVRAWVEEKQVWLLRRSGRLVAAVRAHLEGDRWEIGRLMVAPDLAGRGIGRWLLAHAEAQAPQSAHLDLFAGGRSERNLRMYEAAGYRRTEPPAARLGQHIQGAVFLTKPSPVAD